VTVCEHNIDDNDSNDIREHRSSFVLDLIWGVGFLKACKNNLVKLTFPKLGWSTSTPAPFATKMKQNMGLFHLRLNCRFGEKLKYISSFPKDLKCFKNSDIFILNLFLL
jgi:hypothetical protein